MAFYDWNKDGKKDVQDDFIEYNIYKQSTQNNNNNNYRSGGGISNFGAGVATVIDILVSAGIAGAMGLEGTALVIVFLILAVIIGGVLAWFFDEIGF